MLIQKLYVYIKRKVSAWGQVSSLSGVKLKSGFKRLISDLLNFFQGKSYDESEVRTMTNDLGPEKINKLLT